MVRIAGLRMGNYSTTLMGVLRGVADHYRLPMSDAWLFGGSGHAFLMNIHDQLCPSGPYCWNPETFVALVGNLGIFIRNLGFFSGQSTMSERRAVEEAMRACLDRGIPCSLLNMENQLVSGYDDDHFVLENPWPSMNPPFTPGTLTFQSWSEFGEEVHVDFYAHEKGRGTTDAEIVVGSLRWAVDMVRNPEIHTGQRYHVGLTAYDAWINAVENGFGSSHGNWWNGTVWSECRRMASGFLSEVAAKADGGVRARAAGLSTRYGDLSRLLGKATKKELPDGEKIDVLREAKDTEASCVSAVEDLLKML